MDSSKLTENREFAARLSSPTYITCCVVRGRGTEVGREGMLLAAESSILCTVRIAV
ncbi:hypothetical protein BDV39DRAFT_55674 [Aspergillus sergii]|uniref:Uncharacterized protein n=1 Tax=Aspergillus sergii TaxID=1034303 RepID=A0A5N6X764_9EURO|nr:hypothetical protein BDV39DRAFT_55674 [Aspergillus sergii]